VVSCRRRRSDRAGCFECSSRSAAHGSLQGEPGKRPNAPAWTHSERFTLTRIRDRSDPHARRPRERSTRQQSRFRVGPSARPTLDFHVGPNSCAYLGASEPRCRSSTRSVPPRRGVVPLCLAPECGRAIDGAAPRSDPCVTHARRARATPAPRWSGRWRMRRRRRRRRSGSRRRATCSATT